ncbi:MAG: polyprenyl synthetase family protein [Nitriliruptoraceae bacterium]
MAANDIAPTFDDLRAAIDRALDDLLPSMLQRLADLHVELKPVATTLAAFVNGGKRIRPALLHLGFWCVTERDTSVVHGPALALELLHTCALIHDDIIDGAATRRGRPSVHAQFVSRHTAAGWSGDPQRYGESVAILIGDLAFVQADELFISCGLPADRVLAGFRAFTQMREEVMAGQFLDLQSAAAGNSDREQALIVATMKSGRYSVTRPLEIGAVLAGADSGLIDGLRTFGDPLGRAFQVRDDLLGVFGSPSDTGKSTASDLAEGKRTLLIAEAHARGNRTQQQQLDRWIGDSSLTEVQADELRGILEATGARAAAESYGAACLDQALTARDRLPAPESARQALADIAHRLGFRLS